MPQLVVIELATDQHQLVLAGPLPVAVVNGEAFARQVENVPALAFLEPENPFGPKDAFGKVVVEKILKCPEIKGLTA